METFHSNQSVFISVGATGGQRVIRVVVVVVAVVVISLVVVATFLDVQIGLIFLKIDKYI